MKYSKTALKELTARYRDVLRKCAFLNAIILMGAALSTPAMADDPITENVSGSTEQIHLFNDGGSYEILGSTYTNNGNTDKNGIAAWVTGQDGNIRSNLVVNNSEFTGNVSGIGGAIGIGTKGGTLTVTKSNFTENHAIGDGGAIGAYYGLNVNGGTFARNTAQLLKDGDGEYTIVPENPKTPIGGGAIALGALSSTSIGTIYGTTFDHNKSGLNGGAIGTRMAVNEDGSKNNNSGARLDIVATFTGNEALGSGGAIYNTFYADNGSDKGDGVTVKGEFTQNVAHEKGGAIYNDGTADTTGHAGGVMTIYDSEFTENGAVRGGAIQSTGTLTVNNTDFSKNTASYMGGAINVEAGTTVVNNSTFDKNNGGTYGGAIASVFNTVNKVEVNESEFTENSAELGGAIAAYQTLEVTDSSFTGNHTNIVDDGGGAIVLGGHGKATIEGTTFDGNYANLGGAIATRPRGTNAMGDADSTDGHWLSIENSTFQNNVADATLVGGTNGTAYTYGSKTLMNGDGGAIWHGFEGSTVNGVVHNNEINGSTFLKNTAKNNGGAIFNEGNLSLSDNTFTENTAANLGGAIYNDVKGVLAVEANGANVVFSGNTASDSANDIYNAGTLTLKAAADKTISLAGGIDGAAGTVNIIGAGTVDLAGYLKNQTAIVSAGELWLSKGAADGSNLAGSTVTVNSDATLNTIDKVVNNYVEQVTLTNGAKLALDIDYNDGVFSNDTYNIDNNANVTLTKINLLKALSGNVANKRHMCQMI